jgi:hypothetical protein
MKFALPASLLLCLVSIVDAQTFKKHAVNVAWTHDSLYAALQADACIVVGTVSDIHLDPDQGDQIRRGRLTLNIELTITGTPRGKSLDLPFSFSEAAFGLDYIPIWPNVSTLPLQQKILCVLVPEATDPASSAAIGDVASEVVLVDASNEVINAYKAAAKLVSDTRTSEQGPPLKAALQDKRPLVRKAAVDIITNEMAKSDAHQAVELLCHASENVSAWSLNEADLFLGELVSLATAPICQPADTDRIAHQLAHLVATGDRVSDLALIRLAELTNTTTLSKEEAASLQALYQKCVADRPKNRNPSMPSLPR